MSYDCECECAVVTVLQGRHGSECRYRPFIPGATWTSVWRLSLRLADTRESSLDPWEGNVLLNVPRTRISLSLKIEGLRTRVAQPNV